jgi:hypothetical protein
MSAKTPNIIISSKRAGEALGAVVAFGNVGLTLVSTRSHGLAGSEIDVLR